MPSTDTPKGPEGKPLCGKHVAVIVFSHYPSDPRPRREAEAFIQSGAEVEVISLQQNEHEPRRETYNGVKIFRVPVRHSRGGTLSYAFQYGSFILAGFFVLTIRFLTRRYDLVHVHNMPDVLVFSALVPRLWGAKVILDLHDPMPELMVSIFGMEQRSLSVRLLKVFERWSIGFAHMVLTPNIAFQQLFVARGCPPEKLRVIMNCPDEDIFHYRELADHRPMERGSAKPFVLMYHGALVERHGLDIAVDAFKSVRASVPNAEFHIFGRRTKFLDRVMELVRELELGDSVKYMGAKSLEQIARAIDDCDAGIIPNRRSAFTEINMPTRIFEYLARGKPVIAPRTAGIQDYFNDDELLFFEANDRDDLVAKIQFVFSKPHEVRELVKRGQAVYRGHRWSEERLRFLQGASELLAGHGVSPIQKLNLFGKPTE